MDSVNGHSNGSRKTTAAHSAQLSHHRPLNLKGKRIVLLLQGGGALGAYQVGAFKALAHECANANNTIDWVAGISIGAINSAVIAAPKNVGAVEELESLWDEILSPFDSTDLMPAWPQKSLHSWFSVIEPKYLDWAWMTFINGQPNFFSPRVLNPFRNPWVQQWFHKLDRNELAFYGTHRLAETLDRHVNWLALKDGKIRLSLGATHMCDGEVEFFDSSETDLEAKHVQASGALPPAFPPIQIGDEWYMDGGVSNNTPIEILGKQFFHSKRNTVVFAVDLFDRKNDVLPESFEDLLWRQKCIQYGSRKKAAEIVVERYQHHCDRHPDKEHPTLEVCQVMLEHPEGEPQFSFADADFSRTTFNNLRDQGLKDMTEAIHYPERVYEDQQHHRRPLGGKSAILYRHGSEGKWRADREEHHHQHSKRSNLPPTLEPWMAWWRQSA